MIINNIIRAALIRYIDERREPGGFLKAVLSNDLINAVGRADTKNRADLAEIVQYCYNELPSRAWGSPEKVKAWLER